MQLLCQNVWVKIIQDFFDQCNCWKNRDVLGHAHFLFWTKQMFISGQINCAVEFTSAGCY